MFIIDHSIYISMLIIGIIVTIALIDFSLYKNGKINDPMVYVIILFYISLFIFVSCVLIKFGGYLATGN